MKDTIRSTTIIAVRRDGVVAIAGDGQVTLGDSVVMKDNAKKVRRICKGTVIAGFAGGVADAITLIGIFEKIYEQCQDLTSAAISMSQEWRTNRLYSRLAASILVADAKKTLFISGTGDVMEPSNDILTIGSGGPYAQAAAIALYRETSLGAEEIAKKALLIAGSICIFTNTNVTVETIGEKE